MFRTLLDADPQLDTDGGAEPDETQDVSVDTQPDIDTTSDDAGDAGTQPQAQTGWQGVLEAAREQGLDLSGQFQDDASALAFLVQQARAATQNSYYTQLGQRLAPDADRITQLLKAQQPAQPQQRQPFEPPPFKEEWLQMVERDPQTQVIRSKAGFNPAIGEAVQEWASYNDRLQRDPQIMQQRIAHEASQIAKAEVQQAMTAYRTEYQVGQILQQNSQWLYARDQAGNVQYAQDGRPLPSAEGTRYLSHVQSLSDAGVTNPQQLDLFARRMLKADILAGKNPAPQTRSQPQRAAGNRNPLQALGIETQAANGVPLSSIKGLNLREALRQGFQDESYTDADARREFDSQTV